MKGKNISRIIWMVLAVPNVAAAECDYTQGYLYYMPIPPEESGHC
jgi:hypothetical protein